MTARWCAAADGGKTSRRSAAAESRSQLPVSIDFLGRAFSEPVLIRIAAAYEQATRHRRPPKDFGPLPGEQ